ncbi:tripartite tricarboxylate transporter substrate binding protein [Verticiella sediminum]
MRRAALGAALAVLGLVQANVALAESTTPVNVVVAFPPGGPADRIARVLAQHLSEALGRNVLVENRPGASGMIAASYVARSSDPDSTLFLSNAGALTINPALYHDLSYDPAKDFKAVSMVADTTTVMVTWAPTEIGDAADLVKQARGGKEFSAGSSGVGGASHLSLEMFQEGADIKLLHIPYKGASPALTDLVGRRVDVFFGDLPGVQALIEGGKLKPLGVAAEQPSALLPGVKTLEEQGIAGVVPSGWYGVVMPAAASDEQVQRMSDGIHKALSGAKVQQQLQAMGAVATPNSPAEFQDFLANDARRWQALVTRRGIQASQ